MRGFGSLERLLFVLACAALVAGSATRNDAQASHCVITPTLAKATVGQGLRTRDSCEARRRSSRPTSRPASLPKCAGTVGDIKIVGASLTMRNGTTPLVTVPRYRSVGALVTSKSTMKNQYADPKFVVQGSQFHLRARHRAASRRASRLPSSTNPGAAAKLTTHRLKPRTTPVLREPDLARGRRADEGASDPRRAGTHGVGLDDDEHPPGEALRPYPECIRCRT